MADNMSDLFENVKKMVDSGNIPPEIQQMMDKFKGSSNPFSSDFFKNISDSGFSGQGGSSSNVSGQSNSGSSVSGQGASVSNVSEQSRSSSSEQGGFSAFGQNTSTGSGQGGFNFNQSGFGNGQNFNFDINTIMKMKSIMENMNNKNDPRANLLYSLKPYLRDSKKDKVDQYVNMLNITKIADIMNKPSDDKNSN